MDNVIIGGLIAIVNALVLGLLYNIRADQKEEKKAREESLKDMWHRLYSHYHEVECENDECKKMKTGNVIVPRESR